MKSTYTTAPQRTRIAILLGSPFTEDIYGRIGLPYLAEVFDVTVIDCTKWVRSGADELTYRRHEYGSLVTANDESELAAIIEAERPAYAIDFIGRGSYTRTIQNLLRSANTQYVAQRITPSPLPGRLSGPASKRLSRVAAVAKRAQGWIARQLRNQNPLRPDIALLAGRKSKDHWTSTSGTILWTGSTDYFTLKGLQRASRSGRDAPDAPRERFAVFIDDCLALSIDYRLTGRPGPMDPDEYFRLLRGTLARIEERLSLPVIVAAHPTGKEILDYASFFGDRQVRFDATAELSLGCDVAITHYSTAVAYPVLLRKPIIVLNARRLQNTLPGEFIANMSRLLDCSVVYMDTGASDGAKDIPGPSPVDEDAYRAYERDYISTVRSADANPFEEFVRFALASQNGMPGRI